MLPKLNSARNDSDSEFLTVEKVIDGFSFKLTTGERVRLLGIENPEKYDTKKSDDPKSTVNRKQTPGKLAGEYLKWLIEGKKVKLIKEPSYQEKDQNGRLMRYAYLQDGTFINSKIIKDGYGQVIEGASLSRLNEFKNLQKESHDSKKGLWGDVNGAKQF